MRRQFCEYLKLFTSVYCYKYLIDFGKLQTKLKTRLSNDIFFTINAISESQQKYPGNFAKD